MYVLGQCKCFVYPAQLCCGSHSIDICTVAIKNIKNMHAVSTNRNADILHFNDKGQYKFKCFLYPSSLSRVSHSINICTVAIKNIRNMHAVSTSQIANILHFNDNNLIRYTAHKLKKSLMENFFFVCSDRTLHIKSNRRKFLRRLNFLSTCSV